MLRNCQKLLGYTRKLQLRCSNLFQIELCSRQLLVGTNRNSTVAFGISTIVLGVENKNLKSDLDAERENKETRPMIQYRLPITAKPQLYDLFLKPDLTTGLFSGEVTIHIDLFDEPKEIVLHSHKLAITKVTVNEKAAVWELDPTYELLKIKNENGSPFVDSEAAVYIAFNGDLKNRIVGFYSSNYTGEDGKPRQIATSKFEPTYARQAFPCFDEPNLKAKYKVRLFKPKDEKYIALSNNPEETPVDVEGGQIVSFKQTVPMSTYLVCFIVSDFISTNTTIESEFGTIPFRVFATPAQLSKTTYAADVGKKVIEYYLKYFQIEYPLPKLDMVAIPDFVSGAMEHWGLVTYRETALLYSNTTHSSANKQRVATVIAHELAHSWFGNLVTMNWWNDLWLNEGFASYIEYKGVNSVHPEWGMLDQFIIDDLHPVLSLDATLGSHPIIVSVKTPDEITSVFDTISYNKGASILRMLENTVGETVFQLGVKKYLQKYIYGNAITQNLLDELDAQTGNDLNVTEFIATFTVQMGYPILSVTVDGDKYTFTQKRFLKDPSLVDNTVTPYNYKWSIPITYVTDSGKSSGYTLFKYNEDSVIITKPSGAKWIKFNYDQVGYYRVNYPESEWNKLITVYSELSTADRTHLIEESFSIAESGQLPYTIPLNLTQKLVDEVEYIPWSAASSALLGIKTFLTNSDSETKLDTYIAKIVDKAYSQLTWEEPADAVDKDHLKRLTRVVVLSLACATNHTECLAEAKKRFDTWIADTTKPLSQDLRGLVYRYGMKSANESTWDKLLEVFTKETDANEKLKLLYGLASVKDLNLLKKLITLSEDETYVRSQDYFTLISYVCANPLGPPFVWDYMRDNWQKLVNRFTLNDRNFGRMIQIVTRKFATEERLKEMQDFYAKYTEAGAGATPRKQALETVQNNIKWLQQYKTDVEAWLNQNS